MRITIRQLKGLIRESIAEAMDDVSSEEQGALGSRRAKRGADEERRAGSRKKAILNRDVEVFGANFAAGSGWSLGPRGAAKLDPKSGDLQVTVGHGIVEIIPADAFDVE